MDGKELAKLLKKNGWQLERIKGSHHIFTKNNKSLPVPIHGKKDIPIGTVNKILKLAGLKK